MVAYLRLDRDLAIYIAKHAQRACRQMRDFANDNPALMDRDASARLGAVAAKLRNGVLEPIYAAYPSLRGKDLTEQPALPNEDSFRKDASRRSAGETRLTEAQFGAACARYLDRATDEALSVLGVSRDPDKPMVLPKAKVWAEEFHELMFQIQASKSPIYARLPDILHRYARANAARPMTKEAKEHFQKVAPPAGSVSISPAALAEIRKFYDAVRATPGGEDTVIDISWTLGSAMRGPEDKEWKKQGPGVSIGGWSRRQVPSDVVRNYNGVPIVFGGDTRERFAGKLVNLDGKKFVIKDR